MNGGSKLKLLKMSADNIFYITLISVVKLTALDAMVVVVSNLLIPMFLFLTFE